MSFLILSKYLPKDIVNIVILYLLPNKQCKYKLFQEILNKYNNTYNKLYCIRCNKKNCSYIQILYSYSFNMLIEI